MDRFRITNGEIILAERPDADLIDRIRKATRPQLVVNSSLGFTGALDFLYDVGPLLTSLELGGVLGDDHVVVACSNLLELNLNTDCDKPIPWEVFPHLRHLFTYADRVTGPLSPLQQLETLHLHGANDQQLTRLVGMPALQELRLTSTSMTRVPGGAPWTQLKSLDIGLGSSLKDFSGISGMKALEKLTLKNCRHLSELKFLSSCSALRFLNIGDSGKVESLRPLESCMDLEKLLFYGSTVVVDGDLSVLGRLPRLEGAHFRTRRHYRGVPPRFPTVD